MSTIDIFTALAIGALLILGALAVLNILQHSKQPALHAVLLALEPYIYRAIFAGERFALLGLDQFDTKLSGMDKAAVANSIYDLLPDVLLVGKIPLPISAVKLLVPRNKFQALVRDVYDQSHAFIVRNEDYLKLQVDALQPLQAKYTGASGTPPDSDSAMDGMFTVSSNTASTTSNGAPTPPASS